MTVEASGFGLKIQLVASNTFPLVGVSLSQFADDADALDVQENQIKDVAVGLNGDLITWSKATPIKASLSVLPGGRDDNLLSILLDANRVGKGKNGAFDQITMVATYSNNNQSGRILTLYSGVITDGMLALSVSSAGRYKTRTYNFAFEGKTEVFF